MHAPRKPSILEKKPKNRSNGSKDSRRYAQFLESTMLCSSCDPTPRVNSQPSSPSCFPRLLSPVPIPLVFLASHSSKIALPEHPIQILSLLLRERLAPRRISTEYLLLRKLRPSGKGAFLTLRSKSHVSCLVFLKSLKILYKERPKISIIQAKRNSRDTKQLQGKKGKSEAATDCPEYAAFGKWYEEGANVP